MVPWYLDVAKSRNFPDFPPNAAKIYRIPQVPVIPVSKSLTSLGASGCMVNGGLPGDRRRFSTPSLRKVALTAPYMHDGRFATLEEVVKRYSSGIRRAATSSIRTLPNNRKPGFILKPPTRWRWWLS